MPNLKPPRLVRDFYPLHEAAEMTRNKINDLLSLASKEVIQIHAVTEWGRWVVGEVYGLNKATRAKSVWLLNTSTKTLPTPPSSIEPEEFKRQEKAWENFVQGKVPFIPYRIHLSDSDNQRIQDENKQKFDLSSGLISLRKDNLLSDLFYRPITGPQTIASHVFTKHLEGVEPDSIEIKLNRFLNISDDEFDVILVPMQIESLKQAISNDRLFIMNSDVQELMHVTESVPDIDEPKQQHITEDLPIGITTSEVVNLFTGVMFSKSQWEEALSNTKKRKWLKDAMMKPGKPGRNGSALWNPVTIATLLHDKGEASLRVLDKIFQEAFLNSWRDEWSSAREYLDTSEKGKTWQIPNPHSDK